MKTLLSIALTVLCWGVYGPVLHWGQDAMDHSRLRPFLCVGLAYFVIAVVVPTVYLTLNGESGRWTFGGATWSLAAGAAGAIGALGIILAFHFHARPIFVMPLVFGGAPVINSLLTIVFNRSGRNVGALFVAGLIMVVLGAVTVLLFRPGGAVADAEVQISAWDVTLSLLAILVVVLHWGAYGPVLHKGQLKMEGSRLRPLICVGIAYFAIAVVVPGMILSTAGEQGEFSTSGIFWSLAAGSAGAIGALGIIMAFNFGGRPVYVMPLVFGGAPVVNTFFTMLTKTSGTPNSFFYAGLILVVAGAVIVLVFAPKGSPPPAAEPSSATPDSVSTAETAPHPEP